MTQSGGSGTAGREPYLIRAATRAEARVAAQLHATAIPEGFLAHLGPRFLTLLYQRIQRTSDAELLVGTDGGQIIGFVAVAEDTRALYRHFLLHDAVLALLMAAPSIIRSPRQVWETLRYGTTGDGALPPAEILAIAVTPAGRNRGVGGALASAALDHLSQRGISEASVVTASSNHAAHRMYEKVGFVPLGTTEVHPGIAQRLFLWS